MRSYALYDPFHRGTSLSPKLGCWVNWVEPEAYLTKTRRNEPATCKGSCCAEESPLEVSAGATSIFNVFACRRVSILGHPFRNIRSPAFISSLMGTYGS